MRKLILAAAAILAATLLSGNAFAFTGGEARGLHAASSVVKVHSCGRCRHHRGCAGCGAVLYPTPACGCNGCGLYTYTSSYRCGYGYTGYGCGCAHGCGCGYGYNGCGTGWSFFGWLY